MDKTNRPDPDGELISLAMIREMQAVIAKKIADGEMSPEEGARVFKALTSKVTGTPMPTAPDLHEY